MFAGPSEFDDPFDMGYTFPMTGLYFFPPGTTITIGIFDMDKIGRLLGVGWQLPGITAGRHGAIRSPVECAVTGNDLMTAGIEPGQLDGIVDGRSAVAGEKRFLQVAGSDLRQLLAQFTAGLRYTAGGDIADFLHLA